jgi:hypothetical protein
MIGPRTLALDLAVVLLCALTGCTGTSTTTPSETDADTDTDADADADADADTDTGSEDTNTTPSVGSITVRVDEGDCRDGLYLSLTRVTFGGTVSLSNQTMTYYNYEEQATNIAFTDCEATVSTAVIAPDSADLKTISADLGTLAWALYLPTVYEYTGATAELSLLESPLHSVDTTAEDYDEDALFDGLSGGLSYVGISDTVIAYIEGEGSSIADAMEIQPGWSLFTREVGDTAFELLQSGDDTVISISDTALSFDVTTNLDSNDSVTLGGSSTGRTGTDYEVGLRPYPWLVGEDTSSAHDDVTFLADGNTDWLLNITGVPPAEHYVPAEHVEDLDGFDSCCQQDITVAVEVPITYFDDGDGALTMSDTVSSGACFDSYMVVLLHFAHPTHLWAAEWYHNLGRVPGWRARYGEEGLWWKTLSADDYELLTLKTSCEITSGWDSTAN